MIGVQNLWSCANTMSILETKSPFRKSTPLNSKPTNQSSLAESYTKISMFYFAYWGTMSQSSEVLCCKTWWKSFSNGQKYMVYAFRIIHIWFYEVGAQLVKSSRTTYWLRRKTRKFCTPKKWQILKVLFKIPRK